MYYSLEYNPSVCSHVIKVSHGIVKGSKQQEELRGALISDEIA